MDWLLRNIGHFTVPFGFIAALWTIVVGRMTAKKSREKLTEFPHRLFFYVTGIFLALSGAFILCVALARVD